MHSYYNPIIDLYTKLKFEDNHLGKKFFHQKELQSFDDIFSMTALDKILNDSPLSQSDFLLFKKNKNILVHPAAEKYISKKEMHRLIGQENYSLKINDLCNYDKNVLKFKNELALFFKKKISINLYMTPSIEPCFLEHQDNYEIFILQLEGSKRWYLSNKSTQIPLTPPEAKEIIKEAEIIDLKKGEILYMPPSILHKAENISKTPSVHLTIGLIPLTYEHIMKSLIEDKKTSLFFKQQLSSEPESSNVEIRENLLKYLTILINSPRFDAIIESCFKENTLSLDDENFEGFDFSKKFL